MNVQCNYFNLTEKLNLCERGRNANLCERLPHTYIRYCTLTKNNNSILILWARIAKTSPFSQNILLLAWMTQKWKSRALYSTCTWKISPGCEHTGAKMRTMSPGTVVGALESPPVFDTEERAEAKGGLVRMYTT